MLYGTNGWDKLQRDGGVICVLLLGINKEACLSTDRLPTINLNEQCSTLTIYFNLSTIKPVCITHLVGQDVGIYRNNLSK